MQLPSDVHSFHDFDPMVGYGKVQVEMQLPSDVHFAHLAGDLARGVVAACAPAVADDVLLTEIQLAVNEAVLNAMEHAHGLDPSQVVRVGLCCTADRLSIAVGDHGPGFDFSGLADGPSDPLAERGRGIRLMRAIMDEVTYESGAAVNTLHLHRSLVPPSGDLAPPPPSPLTPLPVGEGTGA